MTRRKIYIIQIWQGHSKPAFRLWLARKLKKSHGTQHDVNLYYTDLLPNSIHVIFKYNLENCKIIWKQISKMCPGEI